MRLFLINGVLAAAPMEQQTTILSISCKQTHLLAMSLDARLKLDGNFNEAESQFVV